MTSSSSSLPWTSLTLPLSRQPTLQAPLRQERALLYDGVAWWLNALWQPASPVQCSPVGGESPSSGTTHPPTQFHSVNVSRAQTPKSEKFIAQGLKIDDDERHNSGVPAGAISMMIRKISTGNQTKYFEDDNNNYCVWVGFQVSTEARMKMAEFWVVAPCSMTEVLPTFHKYLLPPSSDRRWTLMIEAASTSETSVIFHHYKPRIQPPCIEWFRGMTF